MPRPKRRRSITRPKAVGLGARMSSGGRLGYNAFMTRPGRTAPPANSAPADRRLDLFGHAERERLRRLRQLLGGRRTEPPAPDFACEDLAAQRDTPLLLLLLDPLPDLLAGPTGLDMRQPVA